MTITLVLGENGTIGGEDYVLTIPESLTITQDGWNAFDPGINAEAASGKTFEGTLTVTASSDNNWNLVLSPDETDSVSYTLAAEEGGEQNLTWEFTADEVNTSGGTTKTAGVILGDTTGKAAGTYTDTITFTTGIATEPTLADVTQKDGNTLTISFTYTNSSNVTHSNSATFTYSSSNGGSFSSSWEGVFFTTNNGAASMSLDNGNLVAKLSDYNYLNDETEINTITLYPATNRWTFSKGSATFVTSDYKFAVNGVDITSQLTQQ